MTYPMPRDSVFLDPTGGVTTAPGEAYGNEHRNNEELEEETAQAQAAEDGDEGSEEARNEEARAEEGDEDDDAEIHDAADVDDDDAEIHDAADVDDDDADDDDDVSAEADADEDEADEDESGEGDIAAYNDNVDIMPVGIPQPVMMPDPVLEEEPVAAVASGMHPGDADVPVSAATMAGSDDFHERWQQAQLNFIDDPRGATEAARTLASEVLEARISALRDRQEQLDAWQGEATPDTEVLRAAMRAYRDTVNTLTAD